MVPAHRHLGLAGNILCSHTRERKDCQPRCGCGAEDFGGVFLWEDCGVVWMLGFIHVLVLYSFFFFFF